jgi:hypothetical protein
VTLPYPPWWTALDRERVQHAIAVQAPNDLHVDEGARVRVFRIQYPSDAAAVTAVLAVLEVVAAVLTRYRTRQPAEALAAAAAQLSDGAIVDAHRVRPMHQWPTLDAFVAAVHEALAAQPWWSWSEGAATRATPSARARPDPSWRKHPEQAHWVADKMRLANVTPHRLEQFGGPDGKTTQRLLDGYGSRDDVLQKFVNALNEINGSGVPPLTLVDVPRD